MPELQAHFITAARANLPLEEMLAAAKAAEAKTLAIKNANKAAGGKESRGKESKSKVGGGGGLPPVGADKGEAAHNSNEWPGSPLLRSSVLEPAVQATSSEATGDDGAFPV